LNLALKFSPDFAFLGKKTFVGQAKFKTEGGCPCFSCCDTTTYIFFYHLMLASIILPVFSVFSHPDPYNILTLIECLHDPATFQQMYSKYTRIAGSHPHVICTVNYGLIK